MNFKTLLVSLLCVIGTQSSTTQAGEPVVLMSYNIRYQNNNDGEDIWNNRRATVAKALRQAEVFGLQEVLQSQLADLRGELTDYDFYGVGRDDGRDAGEMVPIGYLRDQFELLERGTFWLSSTPEIAGSKGWDAALPRIASWVQLKHKSGKETWLIVNTHFDHRGQAARLESGKLLRRWINERAQTQPVVLLGDFNARASDPPVEALLTTGGSQLAPLRLARLESAKPDTGPDSTWNGFKAIEPGQRIDHVLLSGKLTVDAFETLDPRTPTDRFASDHLPIMVRLHQ